MKLAMYDDPHTPPETPFAKKSSRPAPRFGGMAQIKAFLNAIPHWVIVVLLTSAGAGWTYLQQVGPGSFFDAVQHWATLKPILEGAGGAFLATMIALLRKEPWVTPTAAFLVLCGFAVSACGVGQIFGPGSKIPGDLTADAECFAGSLIAGNLDPAAVFADCKVTETQTIDDLWNFVVDAIEGDGKITPAQASSARDKMQAHRAAKASP